MTSFCARNSSAIAEEGAFAEGPIHQFNILEDGTAVGLCQIHRDLDRARELLGGHLDVLSYSITGGRKGEELTYVHMNCLKPS